jgi:hypothetical protein
MRNELPTAPIFSSPSAKERFHVPASEQRKGPQKIHKVAGAPRVASTTPHTTPQGHSAPASPEQLLATNVPPQTKPFPHLRVSQRAALFSDEHATRAEKWMRGGLPGWSSGWRGFGRCDASPVVSFSGQVAWLAEDSDAIEKNWSLFHRP